MLQFQSAPPKFRRFGLELICYQLFLFVLALPPTRFGSWFLTEPVMMGLFLLATASAVWLALGIGRGWLTLRRPLHPAYYALLGWAALQFLPLITSPLPLMAWFGPPHIGEGSAYQLAFVLSVIVTGTVWDNQKHRNIILACASASLLIMAALHFDLRRFCDSFAGTDKAYYMDGQHNPLAPANWPDYLAFGAAWLWVAYAANPASHRPARHGWAVIILSLVLWLSANKAAILLLFPALIISLSMLIWQCRKRQLPARWMYPFSALLMIVPLSWIGISQYAAFFPCKDSSLASRALYQQASIGELRDAPQLLFAGSGWGFFFDDILTHGVADGAWIYKNGNYAPSNEILTPFMTVAAAYHPHNQALNSLRALGIAGFGLNLLIPILCLLRLPRTRFWWCAPMWVSSVVLSYVWFPLPLLIGFQPLAIVALCAATRMPAQTSSPIAKPYIMLVALLAIAFAGSMYQQGRLILYGVKFWPLDLQAQTPMPPADNSWMTDDNAYGGLRLAKASFNFSQAVAKKTKAYEATEADKAWFSAMLQASAEGANQPHATALQRLTYAQLLMDVLYTFEQPSPLDALKPQAKQAILPAIMRLTEAAPQREDLIAPFLIHLDAFADHDSSQKLQIVEKILEKAPNHRSAMWLKGQLLAHARANADTGKKLMEKAVQLGVAKIYPVPGE